MQENRYPLVVCEAQHAKWHARYSEQLVVVEFKKSDNVVKS